ncbi:resolvase rnase h domain protein fold protein [Leptolyngbya sp. Heron Island J]|uniref:pre-16S rRNA-processing nuclease YqgF n=1 Tax=Leptolyngbya sp. Heron Island J TaxID=1385935 RepID=UPI0003B9486A|nr:pre-16S rRNA-processing nuclease YqgF [Leptolyngbya sp. Heron Island J]ESA33536.1 resolvase rnase h domain protein fold protein [Leptolyngbya sp. Heron Island J]
MTSTVFSKLSQPVILGFDPGRYKCGLAIVGLDRSLCYHEVVSADDVIEQIKSLRQTYPISLIVMGDQTGAKIWKQALLEQLKEGPNIILVDERYSSLEARDRYWEMFPPKGLNRILPQSMRSIPRPIDDIVAILLIERYLNKLTEVEI